MIISKDIRAKSLELMKQHESIKENEKVIEKNMNIIINESNRVYNIASNSERILNNLEEEFESQTKLNKLDVAFLFFATALQCVRQYVLTHFQERVDHNKAGEKTDEASNRSHRWYRPSLEEIINNPVPYDAMFGSKDFNLGLGGSSHRFRTLGHDPLLGWIFGTSNIVTSTLTTWEFSSYHVKTGATALNHSRDRITNKANTGKVLVYTKNRIINEGIKEKIAVGYALLKQRKHIKSDIYTKAGLPLPIISTMSPDLAERIAIYGFDIGNVATVGKQASLAILINTLIAMVHGLFFDKNKYSSWSIYEVKTRKILSYSNLIASTSNILYVAIKKDYKKLDIGGILVTLYRLLTDAKFIRKVKEEFIFGEFNKLIRGKEYDFFRVSYNDDNLFT